MAFLSFAVGAFMITVAPFLIEWTSAILFGAFAKAGLKDPEHFLTALGLATFFFPLWRVAGMIAGVVLLLTGCGFLKGEKLAWPIALSALSVPGIAGLHFLIPWIGMSTIMGLPPQGMPPTLLMWLVALGAYVVLLLIPRGDKMQKLTRLVVFFLLGVIAADAFILGFASTRTLIARPGAPMFQGVEMTILTVGGPMGYIVSIGAFLTIPLLAARKRSGWYVGLGTGLLAIISDFPTQLVRRVTFDFLVGGLLGLALVVVLVIPAVRARLLGAVED